MTAPRDQNQVPHLPSPSTLRKTFIACLITAGFFTYIYIGNLQLLLNSRYSAEVGISDLWVSDEIRYYLHMTAINAVILGVIIFMWVWRRMTGKRFIIMLLFFNLAALLAGYTTLSGKSYTTTNELMRAQAQELALAARGFPTANLDRYPRSMEELKRVYRTPLSPYSYKGQSRPLKIEVIHKASGPLIDLTGRKEEAGTIFYAVDPEGKHFWITYLEYEFVQRVSVFAITEEEGEVVVLTETE